jgi:hypothetical protein
LDVAAIRVGSSQCAASREHSIIVVRTELDPVASDETLIE